MNSFIRLILGLTIIFKIVDALPTCANITGLHIGGARILSISSREYHNLTVFSDPLILPFDVTSLNICETNVTYTHHNANDTVQVQVWLPLNNWNGRFAAIGGSAWAAGLGALAIAPFAAQGFATASTDAGLSGGPYSPGAWALKENGEVNFDLLTNFASRSVHELAVVGKAVTAKYYGTAAEYSYWNGCSTGGRQGLVAAEKYAKDFDGILAGAPAINWPEYVVAEQWPQVVMKEESNFPSLCELNGIVQAAVEACDLLDGVKDNVITNLTACQFDPFSVVGSELECDGNNITVSHSTASIIRKIWDGQTTPSGKSLWYGLNIGAPMDYLANSTTTVNGTRIGLPFLVSDSWIRYFLEKDPNFDTSTLDASDLATLFSESAKEFNRVIGSANPDLSELQSSGGKLLVWHGLADPLIFPQGTVQYRQRVEQIMRNTSDVDDFFRLFLAPGVDHCGQGLTPGAVPTDPFGALISWVENGTAPDVLFAATLPNAPANFTREICRYPLVSKYRGSGDPSSSSNYDCESD